MTAREDTLEENTDNIRPSKRIKHAHYNCVESQAYQHEVKELVGNGASLQQANGFSYFEELVQGVIQGCLFVPFL